MTDKQLTPADVNGLLAIGDGWTLKDGWWHSPVLPNGEGFIEKHPPDYCGKWQHAGPLWQKLWDDAWAEKDVGVLFDEVEIIQSEFECDLTEAISRMELARMDGEE